jgi:DNA-binding beta-propeller fold protein YncE
MQIIVSSASGSNGQGLGVLLAFAPDGTGGTPFATDSGIVDPRGLHVHPDGRHLYVNSGDDRVLLLDTMGKVVAATPPIPELNPGGGFVVPDGRFCVTSRTMRTVVAFPADLRGPGEPLFRRGVVSFPRGFAFAPDGRLFLASGTSAGDTGPGRILAFAPETKDAITLIEDPDLSPLDLTLEPSGHLLVASEVPFGSPSAVGTVREYDTRSGRLVRVLAPDASVTFRRPRGLRLTRDGRLCCVARDEAVAFDLASGRFLGALLRFQNLYGQALDFFPAGTL